MAAIWQCTWVWSGFTGAPGYTNLYYQSSSGGGTEALAAANKSRILFQQLATTLPTGMTLALNTDVKELDDATGDLLDIWTVSGVAGVTGSGLGQGPSPAGACIDWLTTTVHAGRRMQGRTFIVPLPSGAYQSDGTINTASLGSIQAAAEAMRTATGPTFGVWGRPRPAVPTATPPRTAVAGLWGPAVSSRVPDKTVVLRSRRD